jgi:hypothetical protein
LGNSIRRAGYERVRLAESMNCDTEHQRIAAQEKLMSKMNWHYWSAAALPSVCRQALRYAALTAVVSVSIFATSPQTFADVLAAWDTGGLGGYGPTPWAPTSSDSNITVVGLTRGSGIGTSGTAGANAWGGTTFTVGASSADAGIAANEFATFTLTPNAGQAFSLDSIDPYNIRRSNTGPMSGQWQYSLDNSTFANIGSPITWGSNTSSTGNNQTTISLSGISDLQNVPSTTTVTVRLALWGATNVGGTWYINQKGAGTDFSISGSVSAATAGGNLTPATDSVVFPQRIVSTPAAQAVALNEVGGSAVNYTSTTGGDAIVTSGNSGLVPANGSGSITVGINTGSAGAKSGTVTVNDGQPSGNQIAVSGNVYDHSSAAFLSNGATSLTLNLGSFAQGSGSHSIVDSIFNKLQTAGFTADLDFDSVAPGTGAVGVLSTNLTAGAFTALAASEAGSPTPFPFNATLDANNAPGVYNASYQLALSDADSYAGAGGVGSQTLTLNLTGTITGTGPVLAGDFNNDGKVDASDYVVWRKNETANGSLPNDNGLTTQAERYSLWRAGFGNAAPGSGSELSSHGAAVPEPRSAVLLIVALFGTVAVSQARRRPTSARIWFAT